MGANDVHGRLRASATRSCISVIVRPATSHVKNASGYAGKNKASKGFADLVHLKLVVGPPPLNCPLRSVAEDQAPAAAELLSARNFFVLKSPRQRLLHQATACVIEQVKEHMAHRTPVRGRPTRRGT